MTPEQIDYDRLIAAKETRLPKGLRIYVRRLKEWEVWDKVKADKVVEKRTAPSREERARKELHRTISLLLQADDPKVEARLEIKSIWLMQAAGVINSAERMEDIIESIDSKAPQLKAFLEGKLAAIRDEVKPFMPAEGPSRGR